MKDSKLCEVNGCNCLRMESEKKYFKPKRCGVHEKSILDYFNCEINVGDRYFYGSPPTFGRVIKLRKSSIMLDIGWCHWDEVNRTMNCNSPDKGICIDKAPNRAPLW